MADTTQHKHTARVLLRWAGNARRRAAAALSQPTAVVEPRSALPDQLELFA